MPWSGDVFAAIPLSLLTSVVAGEVGVLVVGIVLFLGHGVLSGRGRRRTAMRVTHGGLALDAALQDGADGAAGLRQLGQLPRRVQTDVLAGVAPRLSGAQRERLTDLAAALGLLAAAEARCGSRLWWRRLHGARICTLLGGGAAAMAGLLGDRRPEVRAQAAEWVVEHHDDELIDLLLRMLEVDEGATRFSVMDSLIRIRQPLLERLAQHLSVPGGPSRARVLEVAIAVADPALLPAGLMLCDDDVPRVRALAACLIGAIGGVAAVDDLIRLLKDEAPEVRAAAARALGKVGHWPAAALLSGLLGDRSWEVRRQAGVALRSLGSPGVLFLRRALTASDPFAADAARQMLDLPTSTIRTF